MIGSQRLAAILVAGSSRVVSTSGARLFGTLEQIVPQVSGTWRTDELFLKGYQIYRNYFRDHDTLGKTPAEAANIKIEGRNKWITVIQNASKSN